MFFLVSGAAASGKSTLVKNLSTRIEYLVCHDYDERKVENEYTRCQQLEQWVQLALQSQAAGQDFLLASHSPLGELLACPSAPKLNSIAACLLDCSDAERISRMRRRGIDPRWPPNQDVISWAAWHRLHAWDPQWEQRVIVGNGPPDHMYTRWTGWPQTDSRWRVNIIDTTNASIEQALEKSAAWVKAEKERFQLLSPDTRWWV